MNRKWFNLHYVSHVYLEEHPILLWLNPPVPSAHSMLFISFEELNQSKPRWASWNSHLPSTFTHHTESTASCPPEQEHQANDTGSAGSVWRVTLSPLVLGCIIITFKFDKIPLKKKSINTNAVIDCSEVSKSALKNLI